MERLAVRREAQVGLPGAFHECTFGLHGPGGKADAGALFVAGAEGEAEQGDCRRGRSVVIGQSQLLEWETGRPIDVITDLHIRDRKSTRLNSSHLGISYAVFCLKKTFSLETVVANAIRLRVERRLPSPLTMARRTKARPVNPGSFVFFFKGRAHRKNPPPPPPRPFPE